ncbi:MAG: M48 family metallopeptidase, partial [Bacteroidota bacterium]
MPAKHTISTTVELSSGIYPVKVFFENRSAARAAVGTKQLILRCPLFLSKPQKAQTWTWFMDWLRKVETENSAALRHLQSKPYTNGSILKVGERIYTLYIKEESRKSIGGKLTKERKLEIKLPKGISSFERSQLIKTTCSRLVAKDFLPSIKRRVFELNKKYFQQEIRDVKLKYNSSNWGSCSSNKIINLSTRLLFAPAPVIDYVIIHE